MVRKKCARMSKDERQRKVARLYTGGKTQEQVAEIIGCSQPLVCKDIKEISNRWKEEAIQDIGQLRQMELKKLEELESKMADMFEKTQEAKWLDLWLKAMERKTKFLGLDAAVSSKVEMEAKLKGKIKEEVVIYIPDDGRN